MLVLTRKATEEIRIGNDITTTVVHVRGDRVKLGLSAPPHVRIVREEILRRIAVESRISLATA